MAKILICDDETDIVNALKIYLCDPSYELFEAYDGMQALDIIERNDIDLVLLDLMMPKMDGISALHKIRERYNMPVIILSAKSEDGDKVLGLNIGADDYITKPFNPIEVTARVNSQLRRYLRFGSNVQKQDVFELGGIVLDDRKKEVNVDDKKVNLTPKEYEILKLLLSHPDEVFSPSKIYSSIWKEEPYGAENTVAVHIRHLREKIEIDPAEPRYIKVIFGQGYKIEKGRSL
ncbi:MAG: response regulator transcription factor [Erysipelotrichaceae bacterium]|nr:response regulator transcription factor [Erysipelotrichaceae bacterium]